MPRLPRATPRTISEITRRDIFDTLTLENVNWAGCLEEPDVLARIYDLADMRSTDGRFKDAAGDIWQHRVNNPQDWEDDWVFTDSRFDLMHGDDETLLRFLAEMVHPAVRPDGDEARALVESINKKLAADGWALVEVGQVSGRPIYGGRRIKGARQPTTALKLPEYTRLQDPAVFHEHRKRFAPSRPPFSASPNCATSSVSATDATSRARR